MSDEIKKKISQMSAALENFEAGKPLPIAIEDIHFLLGCSTRLLKELRQLEVAYNRDFISLNEELDKFRSKWKEARKISVVLNERLSKYTAIIEIIKTLPWWMKSRRLKLELESLANLEKKKKKLILDES